MAKIRVYQLAEKWGFDKLWLVEELNKRGHHVKNHLSSLDESALDFKPEDLPPEGRKKVEVSEEGKPGAGEIKKIPKKAFSKNTGSATAGMLKEAPAMCTGTSVKEMQGYGTEKPGDSMLSLPGVSLAIAIVAGLISLAAIFVAQSGGGSEPNSAVLAAKAMAREQILKDLSQKLKEQEALIRELLKDTVVKSEKSTSLNQLHSQAKILKELASRTGVADKERLEEVEKAVEELVRSEDERPVKY
ncbi:MAG: translation initiation factor IF-2 N-terminal domain-containing protein [Nitrospinae bacterium]|nr:translation initiation factor IF-2 N-terminal domain-containing protein [Nitrospinota bacterium]